MQQQQSYEITMTIYDDYTTRKKFANSC